ncbi:DUF2652 domain-containing protein [Fulvivirga sp. M361]|uniref:DUF2652 domain-containing protein n=1 Tax=Fulvivirga sp. M361 TaxID=2594266 RepID=UPI00117B4CA6|nr:DUF2652 domain-containing protein [Fulvivirga sp. M361]TRX46453.1 DUF2652 domain-containing protein [Fulvivirga sp. M361]
MRSTKMEDSRQVIGNLLEVLIEANILNMQSAEKEGDAIFFYIENGIPTLQELLKIVVHSAEMDFIFE